MSLEIHRRERDIIAGRGDEMWPSQGHCTEVIFIDHSTVEGTHAETCTVVEVNFSLKVIVTGFRTDINGGEVLKIGLVQILIVSTVTP